MQQSNHLWIEDQKVLKLGLLDGARYDSIILHINMYCEWLCKKKYNDSFDVLRCFDGLARVFIS